MLKQPRRGAIILLATLIGLNGCATSSAPQAREFCNIYIPIVKNQLHDKLFPDVGLAIDGNNVAYYCLCTQEGQHDKHCKQTMDTRQLRNMEFRDYIQQHKKPAQPIRWRRIVTV